MESRILTRDRFRNLALKALDKSMEKYEQSISKIDKLYDESCSCDRVTCGRCLEIYGCEHAIKELELKLRSIANE